MFCLWLYLLLRLFYSYTGTLVLYKMPEKIKRTIILRAIEEAKLAHHKHLMGSVIFDKRYIISSGHNYPSKSLKHFHPKFARWKGSVHAEVDAIIRARRDIKGCSLLIIRLLNTGLGMAKPCDQCFAYLSHVGIKNVYYSNNLGEIVNVRL